MIVFNRLAASLPTLLIVSLLVFWFVDFIPGDPARILAGPMATQEEVDVIRDAMGLNEPAVTRYVRFIEGIVNPDVAVSLRTGRPVATEIAERLPNTLIIAIGGLVVGLLAGTITGVICALRQGTWIDTVITVLTLAGISMPIFWLGLLCIWLFAVYLGWLPPAGAATPAHFVLPILTVASRPAAMFSRLVTASLLEVMGRDYLDTARSKGLSESSVMVRHALRNSLVAAISVAGVQFGAMLGGSVITETVFGIPGIGRLLVDAVSRADYPIIQYSILLFSFFFVLINLVTDLLTLWLDPRTRKSEGAN
ncbi:ABC transporter permease subunit [Aliihoeflea aestuarii]|jgi:ABC-type dipeptide/oligopeptide/nickel transport system permease component|uniref:ABC transporter permease n=1 Tax=Aliihoeflea aestuarii TaxID=453840 RepID=UPI00209275B4|nr:ABC transporter permease [Aliihoeflea aestuarii]MCO6390078.1 ABC transporter permease subunit [Aliihoeflea aestuarii]